MDPMTIMEGLLEAYFFFANRANKTREERDAMYDIARKKFESLPHPSTLADTEE